MHAYGVVYNTQASPTLHSSPVCGTRGLLAGTGERCFNRFKGLIASRFVHRVQLVKHVECMRFDHSDNVMSHHY